MRQLNSDPLHCNVRVEAYLGTAATAPSGQMPQLLTELINCGGSCQKCGGSCPRCSAGQGGIPQGNHTEALIDSVPE